MDGKGGHRDFEALLALVRHDASEVGQLEALAEADLARVIKLSIEHRVSAIVGKRLRRLDVQVPSSAKRDLERVQLLGAARRLHTERAIAHIADVVDVPFLVVKGPVIAERWYSDAADRDYGDLDVVVRRSDFRATLALLEAHGCETLLDNWHGWLDAGVAEVPLRFGFTTIDLHWSLIALAGVRREIRLPEDQMFERRVTTRLGCGTAIEFDSLDPPDSGVHLCVNVALDGARRLRNLVDLDRMLRHPEFDAPEFARRVRAAGAARMVILLLDRCRRLLHTPLPVGIDPVVTGHRVWRRAGAVVDSWARPFGHSLPPGVVVSAGRPTAPTTSVALAKSLRSSVGARLGAAPPTAAGGRLDWNRRPSDGDVQGARGRYLDWVDAGGEQPNVR